MPFFSKKGEIRMLNFGRTALDVGPSFFMLVPLLLTLAFYGFIVYVLVSLLRFMKQKTESDRERNAKLGELIRLMRETTAGSLPDNKEENR
jgi:membrane protein implicated in regulation of membrane protease activity